MVSLKGQYSGLLPMAQEPTAWVTGLPFTDPLHRNLVCFVFGQFIGNSSGVLPQLLVGCFDGCPGASGGTRFEVGIERHV